MQAYHETESHASVLSPTTADESRLPRIVITRSGKLGTVVGRTKERVYVRLWLHIGGGRSGRVPARVIVAYPPSDVRDSRGSL